MYIYKLGHSPDFGVREFEFLTKQTALWHNQNWLISQDFCDTSVCGSLIFGGQIANDLEIQGLENWKLENQAKFNKSFNEIENEAQIKNSKNLQNTNNSLQNWNEENKSLGQKLKINLSELENELENLDEIDNKNLLALLGEFLTNNPYKKVGIAILTSFDQQKVMNLAKKCGSKKINIISCLPNYGHWKSCKKWLVIIQNPIRKISQKDENVNNYKTENLAESFQNLQKLQFQKFILFEIKSFCNQEFWANLDQNLPSGEMSRGLMNLKLARTLVNLTDKKIILDPFCGSGRTMAAGFGLDKKFILSDVEEVCAKEVSDNLEFLENEKNGKLWKKNQDLSEKGLESDLENDPETENLEQDKNEKIQQNNLQNLEQNLHQNLNENSQLNLKNSQNELSKTLKTSKLLGNLTLDATELGKLQNQKEMENLDFGDISIVTEGFLGTNFKNTPNSKQIQAEFENLELIWTKTLSQSSKLGIEEIIFCLPFYNLKKSENLGGDKLETKNGIKKINHKKRFAENVEFDKSYNNSNKKINSQKSQKTDNSTSFDHKINKNDKLQKIELEEDFEEQFEIKNKNKERNMTKPKLITSNLAAKSTNYQSKSQTWTPQNNSKDNFKKDYKKGSFDSKNSEKKENLVKSLLEMQKIQLKVLVQNLEIIILNLVLESMKKITRKVIEVTVKTTVKVRINEVVWIMDLAKVIIIWVENWTTKWTKKAEDLLEI